EDGGEMVLRWMGVLLMTVVASGTAHAGTFGTVEIAPVEEALTFARDKAGTRLLLVSAYEGGEVTGIDLTAAFGVSDPVALYNAKGYDAIAAASGGEVTLPLSELGLPVDLTASHIAAGTNFPEHAEESTVEDGPFLFAKEVEPTPFDAPIPAGDALLDYEVELCFVALEAFDISQAPAEAGLILCNDVTDRAKLMRNI